MENLYAWQGSPSATVIGFVVISILSAIMKHETIPIPN
jgi:hypothetical protein